MFFFYLNKSSSQFISSQFADTTHNINYFNQIFDKQFNIYRFASSISFSKVVSYFKINFNNEYEGFFIKANENSKKDAEKLNLEISREIISNLNIFAQANYILNSDSKLIGLSEAEKINGNIGFSLIYPYYVHSFISFGSEKNKQVEIVQTGPRFFLGTSIDKIQITDIDIISKLSFEQINLKDGRKNSNLYILSKLNGNFEDNNSLILTFDYSKFRRDYLVFPIYLTNFFETRYETKIYPAFSLNYNLFKQTYFTFTGQFNYYSIRRNYNLFDPTNLYTSVEKILFEHSTELNFELYSQNKLISPRLGFNYFYRNEENIIDKKYEIDNQSFSQLSITEFQKNNYQSRLKLFYNFNLLPHKSNETNITGNLSILRYDTPSTLNDDDRDEFTFLTSFSTKQKFSNFYSINLSFDLQLSHLVFLKSTKSSLNNWNRIIKLSVGSNYLTELFSWKPNFEIFSNYLVYDFEMTTSSTRSYAFRQFVYRDSFELSLSRYHKITNYIVYKFSERGNLYWNEFSMTKELEINEIFSKTMLYCTIDYKMSFGIGVRIYNIKHAPKTKLSGPESFEYYSFSPETEIKIFLGKDNVIFLQGWYELKFWNKKIVGKNPNLLLSTKVNL